MKKFKIIEESRFVTKDEMGNIYGGTTCGGASTFTACGSSGYTTCGMGLVDGYNVTFCGGLSRYVTCGGPHISYVKRDLCGSVEYHGVTDCGGSNIYTS